MLRTVLALALAAHGIGHILFLVPLLGFAGGATANWGQSVQSWLLHNPSLERIIGSLIWAAAIAAFCAAAYGLFNQQLWWRELTVIASLISLAGLALFWSLPASTSFYFALGFDVVALAALLIAHWPTAEALGV
jgi:hypothetical protein